MYILFIKNVAATLRVRGVSVDQFGVWVKPHHLFSIYILYIVNIYDEGAGFAIPPLHPLRMKFV